METASAGHAVDLAREAVADGVSIIAAAGGDGTIHDVANGILQATEDTPTPVALGIIPIGTGNDFAKMVPGGTPWAEAVRTLAAGRTTPYDVGIARWGARREYFLNAIGTGVDVEVVRQIQRLGRGTGPLVYLEGLLRALVRYRALPVEITADGGQKAEHIVLAAVSNGQCVGGMFRITPAASPTDGRLDLCVVADMSLASQLALVPRILRGTHVSSPRVQSRRVREVVLRVPAGLPLYFQIDGELREPAGVTELRIDVLPGRLPVVIRAET
jgi:YegS/Rv2252/BmrU family lipid kinase